VLLLKDFSVDTSRWKLVNNFVVIALSLWGVSRHDYSVKDVSIFESFLIEAFAPIQRGTLSVKEKITYMFDHYVMIVDTSKNNADLKNKVLSLENNIFKLEEVQKENMRLKQLLQFGAEIPREKVLAQVVSWDSSNEFKVLRINKGSNNGLKKMSPVITMTGLVGYVYRLSPNYADVLTILDQNNRVDAIISRTRSHGIVEGDSSFKCSLKYVIRTEQLEDGDEVITAGLGNIYPKGIKIGKVSKIDKEDYGITQTIEITPSVDFHKLEEVVVLIEREGLEVKDQGNVDMMSKQIKKGSK
jgi:rod shape-determining protein MreC